MVAVIFCPLTTVKLVAAIPPMVTPVTVLKERPLMVMVVPPPVGPAAGEILCMIGTSTMLATFTEVMPLGIPFVVTTAPRVPRVGGVLKVTVSWVAVALVTVPVPLLKVTVLLAAVGLKPAPVMVSVVALIARLLVLGVTVRV